MQEYLIDRLQCPACRGALHWEIITRQSERIEQANAHCADCSSAYPIRDGIGNFLLAEGNPIGWDRDDGRAGDLIRMQPDVERRLLTAPLESLSPVDGYYQGMLLEERGEFARASIVLETVLPHFFTPEYLICRESQFHYILDRVQGESDFLLDLTAGRGELLEELARNSDQPLVAGSASPGMLLRLRRRLEHLGLYNRVSLLALDIRHMPFKDCAIPIMTMDQGMAHVHEPLPLLREMRRGIARRWLAVHAFYSPEDLLNQSAIQHLGLSGLLFWQNARQNFSQAGWTVRKENTCRGWVKPLQKSAVLAGIGSDSLPVEATMIEWCTLIGV